MKTNEKRQILTCYQVNQYIRAFNLGFNNSSAILSLIYHSEYWLLALLLVLVYFTVSFSGYPNLYPDGLYKCVSYKWLQIFPPTVCMFFYFLKYDSESMACQNNNETIRNVEAVVVCCILTLAEEASWSWTKMVSKERKMSLWSLQSTSDSHAK